MNDVEQYTVFLFHQVQLGADTSTHERNAQAKHNRRQGLRHHNILHQVVQTHFRVSVGTVITYQTPYICDKFEEISFSCTQLFRVALIYFCNVFPHRAGNHSNMFKFHRG